jgi:signal transduction histidine kinase
MPPTVLVVDDEPSNVEVIQAFLEAEGWRVVTAEDGEGALMAVAVHSPDVVLLDVRMPPPDGFEVCRRLKDDPATAFVPVIIITARGGLQERIQGAEAGADEFLSKPFDHVELVTRVKALLRAKRYHDQLQAYNAELERRVAQRTAELQAALNALRSLDRLKSEFITNVSHELRTPLLHVTAFMDLLAEGALGQLNPRQAEGLDVAQEAVDRLERVVIDVVDFSSLHEQALNMEPLYLTDVCRNVIHGQAAFAARREAEVRLDLAPDLPRVLADRVALNRILRHLLDNAIKFGPVGQVVRILGQRAGERVRVAVCDQGPGLAPADAERIFEAFQQVDGSTTRRAGGLGMGLALVKRLVEAHGSHVQVQSAIGQGSEFSFDLAVAA